MEEYTNMKDSLNRIWKDFERVAKDANMSWYYDQIKRECDDIAISKMNQSEEEKIIDRLEKIDLNDDQVIVINTLTGCERKACHVWAEKHEYKYHISLKSDLFDENIGFYCRKCEKLYYMEELSTSLDWSMSNPGTCYGTIIKCKKCRSFYDDEDPREFDLKRIPYCYNAVMIGNNIPKLSKKETYKKKKSYKDKTYDEKCEIFLRSRLPREIKVVDISSFKPYVVVEGREFFRNLDK